MAQKRTFWQKKRSYNTRQIKTEEFFLTKARSNAGSEMMKHSEIKFWSRIHSEKKCVWHFVLQNMGNVLHGYYKHNLCSY